MIINFINIRFIKKQSLNTFAIDRFISFCLQKEYEDGEHYFIMINNYPDLQQEDTAEFNSALAMLKRINELEYEVEISLIHWDLRGTFAFLESYENELCFSFGKDDVTDIDKQKKLIKAYFNKFPNMGVTVNAPLGRKKVLNNNVTPIVRDLLITLNKTLRKLKHKYGMSMPKKGDNALF